MSEKYSWVIILCCGIIRNFCLAYECEKYYVMEKTSAQGSNGVVMKAQRISDHSTIVIKHASPELIRHELEIMTYIKYFVSNQEQIAGMMQYEEKREDSVNDDYEKYIRKGYNNFVALLGTCIFNGQMSIRMEYLPRILREEMDVRYQTPSVLTVEAPNFVTHAFHLVEAIELLYYLQLVHGDLHPGNIGFNAEGALKVFDFGNSFSNLAPLRRITCLAHYAAPEMLLFEEISERNKVDTWSVGAIIYEMFSGKKFIDLWAYEYEQCERKSPGVTWVMYSTCSGRAIYYAVMRSRCTIGNSGCAKVYQIFEHKLENECTPNPDCLSIIEKNIGNRDEFDEKMKSLARDEEGRLTLANVDKNDLIDILSKLLWFDYTERINPMTETKQHKLFEKFGMS